MIVVIAGMIVVIIVLVVLVICNLMLWHSIIEQNELFEEMVDEFLWLKMKLDKE